MANVIVRVPFGIHVTISTTDSAAVGLKELAYGHIEAGVLKEKEYGPEAKLGWVNTETDWVKYLNNEAIQIYVHVGTEINIANASYDKDGVRIKPIRRPIPIESAEEVCCDE
jgi:hypothetical protein